MKQTGKLLAILLAVFMIVGMIPMTVAAEDIEFTAQELDADGWIAISSPEEFLKIGSDTTNYPVKGNYYLTNDIDFTDYSGTGTGVYSTTWLVELFSGVLDGRGYTIKGFAINSTSKGGVFKQLAKEATVTIRNLNIGEEDARIQASVSGSSESNFGFIAAENGNKSYRIIIENVNVYGDCNVTSTGNLRIGGFIGYCRDITITDSLFKGSITVDSSATTEKNVGGLIALTASDTGANRSCVIKKCNVDADITIKTDTSNKNERLGGILGYCGFSALVDDCIVSGKCIGTDYVGGVAGVVGNTTLFAVTDCTVTADVQGSSADTIYGYMDGSNCRFYIRNCTAQNTEARDIGDFTGDFNSSYRYVWLIDEEDDFAKIGGTDTYTDANGDEQTYTYSRDGFYRMENDIVMTKEYTDAIIKDVFGGVFDGNDKAVKGLVLNDNTSDAGFFAGIAHSTGGNDVAILDFSIGTADSFVSMSTSRPTGGVLAGYAGHTTSNYNVIISGVDIYANVVNTSTGGAAFGGFIGYSRRVNYNDCNMYGSIKHQATITSDANISGFAGVVDVDKTVFYNCSNFADITVNDSVKNGGSRTSRAAGFVAYSTKNMTYLNCTNYGDISNVSDDSVTNKHVGGFIASADGTSAATALDCANFGTITSNGYAGGFTAWSKRVIILDNFRQYGIIEGTTKDNYANKAADSHSLSTLNCSAGSVDAITANALTMVDGASIRLAAPTGLRYMATVSVSAIRSLEEIYGENAVISYGIMIAPQAFIKAGGSFTHEALDAYSTEANGFTGGDKAYVDIPVEKDESGNDLWFKNEEGVMAGSLVGIDVSLYGVNLCGTAYITVTVYGNTVYTTYAQTTEEKNMRTVTGVATAAMEDVLYEKDGTFYTDAALQNEYKGSDVADYDNKIEETSGYNVYSCYSNAERAVLEGILNPTVAE